MFKRPKRPPGGEAESPPVRVRTYPIPQRATNENVQSWIDATTERIPPHPVDITNLQTYLRHKDRKRWERLQRDFAWMEATLTQLGINPEDARWVL